jgi:toxin-antitoxin system PIN domain toxin
MSQRLVDVNVLLALAHAGHPQHTRAEQWFCAQPVTTRFATCSITEIGFLRVSLHAKLQPDLASAQKALAGLLSSRSFVRLPDDVGGATLPAYVTKAAEVTDGHLLALASRHGARLATFDLGIPGAELIR